MSTDEESSSGAGESDDELGKNLENMLHGKNSHQQLSHEQEEMEREELKKLLAEDKKVTTICDYTCEFAVGNSSLLAPVWHPLPLMRTLHL